MTSSKQKCITCGKDFLIIEQEANFLSGQGYPLPQECSYCRQERRTSLRGSRKLVKSKCAKCSIEIIVPENFIVFVYSMYCDQCYSDFKNLHDNIVDNFQDNTKIPDEPIFNNFNDFYREYLRLTKIIPKASRSFHSDNCLWSEYNVNCKNLQHCFDNFDCQNDLWVNNSYLVNDSIDCDFIYESQYCYECQDIENAYHCGYINYGDHLTDCYYCFACTRSHHLFGCIYLEDKSYCIFNRQYSKEEYENKIKEFIREPAEKNLAKVQHLIDESILTKSKVYQSENSDYGNYIFDCKNVYLSFDAFNSHDCGYLYDTGYCNDCWDTSRCRANEKVYQAVEAYQVHNSSFINDCFKSSDSQFLNDCTKVSHSFGCVGLFEKQFCILNRQFSPEVYQSIVDKLLKQFKEEGIKIDHW